MSEIFISYAREDRVAAERLYKDLQNLGFSAWIDEADLLPGQRWKDTVRAVIKDCELFIALISNRSLNKKGFVQRELSQALDILEEYPPGSIFVIPGRLEECTPRDERLSRLHWVDFFPSYKNGFEDLLKSMPHSRRNPEAIVGNRDLARAEVFREGQILANERLEIFQDYVTIAQRAHQTFAKIEALEKGGPGVTQWLNSSLRGELSSDSEELNDLIQRMDLLCSRSVIRAAGPVAVAVLGFQIAAFSPRHAAQVRERFGDLTVDLIPSFKIAARQELGLSSTEEALPISLGRPDSHGDNANMSVTGDLKENDDVTAASILRWSDGENANPAKTAEGGRVALGEASAVMRDMTGSVSRLNANMSLAKDKLKQLAPRDKATRKSLVNGLADDMNTMSAKIEKALPQYIDSYTRGFVAYGRTVTFALPPPFFDVATIEKFLKNVQSNKSAVDEARRSLFGYRQPFEALPKTTSKFNRAKRRILTVFDQLGRSFDGASNVLSEVEKVAKLTLVIVSRRASSLQERLTGQSSPAQGDSENTDE